jgi:hypothetical protein
MTQSRALPAGDVMRSRMVRLLADGVAYQKIQDLLDTTAPTIARRKRRFLQHRIAGLRRSCTGLATVCEDTEVVRDGFIVAHESRPAESRAFNQGGLLTNGHSLRVSENILRQSEKEKLRMLLAYSVTRKSASRRRLPAADLEQRSEFQRITKSAEPTAEVVQ